jgi:ataxia telangiectasia mutated family protein
MLPALSNDVLAKIQLEEAQLCWSIQDVVTAKRILRQLSANENVNPRLHAMALKMSGKWMVESSSENRQTIIENYFRKSLTLLDSSNKTSEDQKSILDTFDQLAKFADREYQEVMTHIKSDIFQKKKENIVKATQNVSNINLKRATRDLQKAVSIKVKQSKIDETEIMNIEVEKNNLLQSALKYYLLNLIGSDDHNITIFRLISLLLENRNNDLIRPVLTSDLSKIPSYKFIAVLPQLIPHISTGTNDPFSQTVDDVIERCARDHPHHALPLILSLALSNKDRDYAESKAVANEARMRSARSLLDRLENDETLAGLVEKMEYVSEALIELAYYKPRGESDGDVKVPKNCKIRAVQNYDEVLLPTHTLPVEPSRGYNRIVGIRAFGEVYSNVGGINAPKRITCKATDGTSRTQLVKGQDDLRQDAVMQQVFTMMNSLLTINKQTKNLRIRTYKIVPLSMRSGVLEWVENTMPIGEYLAGRSGDGGAHTKYRPKDKNPHRCRVDFKVTRPSGTIRLD